MTLRACPREKELSAQLRSGHWPGAVPSTLRDHVAACSSCRSLVAVTQAFRADRAVASAQARLDSPGALFWRAQLRRRNAALERISRPVLGAQIFAVVLTLIAAGVFLAIQARDAWLSWLGDLSRAFHLSALIPAPFQNYAGTAFLVLALLAAAALAGGAALHARNEKR
jgi:hypothetical protein